MTRGQRNNNPGNIRLSSQAFAGEIKGADKVFKTFSTMAYGYRALIRILINYQELHGCNTIRKIINRWAPNNENATSAYVEFVCADTGYMADEAINTHQKDVSVKLARAISKKIVEINAYNDSSSVNGFTYNGIETWLVPSIRSNYLTSISSAELLGETEIIFALAGQAVTIPLQNAKILLAKIQRYADACYLVTQTHLAEVSKLTSIDAVNSYDITAGYPTKLSF